MNNLFIPHTHEGFNTDVLKPGMFVKFSVIKEYQDGVLRIENTGMLDYVDEDSIGIITNISKAIAKSTFRDDLELKYDSDKYLGIFSDNPGECSIGPIGSRDTVCIEMTAKYAKDLSLKLSFLDEHEFDANTMCHAYYWR